MFTFSPSSPLTMLVATWMDTAEVNADSTGAEMKFTRKPESKDIAVLNTHVHCHFVSC